MATKEEWKEFFELTEGRKPTIEEFTAAMKNGDIDGVTLSQPANEPLQKSGQDQMLPPASQISKTSKFHPSKKFILITSSLVVVFLLLGMSYFASQYFSYNSQLSRYIDRYNRAGGNIKSDLGDYVWANGNKSIQASDLNVAPSLPAAISASKQLSGTSFERVGSQFLIFPLYKAVVKPQTITLTTNSTGVSFSANGTLLKNTGYSKKITNLFPGNYQLVAKAGNQTRTQNISAQSGNISANLNFLSGSVTLWVDENQVSSYRDIVNRFETENPDVYVTVENSPSGSANAKIDVTKDPSTAADVFEVPNDQLGSLIDGGDINPVSSSVSQNMKSNDTSYAIQAVSYKNKIYAFPASVQTMLLYYDKSKLTADDVKSWSTLTAKGALATDFSNAYYIYPIFFSAGTTLFGKNGEDVKGTTANSENGVNALKWIAAQKANPNVINLNQNNNGGKGTAASLFQSGSIAAAMDGPWDAQQIQSVLGSNFAAAPYPTVTIGQKSVPLQAFIGVESFAVNAQSSNQDAASALAEYLTNQNSQLTGYEQLQLIPVNKADESNSNVQNDPVASAVIKQSADSTVMPKLSQMAYFWNDSMPLVSDTYNGQIPSSDYSNQLNSFVSGLSQ